MVKLVRLESDYNITESQFTNNLGTAIHLGKNAAVALKTMTLQFKQPPINVTNLTNTIQYSTDTGAGSLRTAVIPAGSYSVPQMMERFQLRFNSLLQSYALTESDIGFEWYIEGDGNNVDGYNTVFGFDRETDTAITSALCSFTVNATSGTMKYASNMFSKNIADDGTYNAGLIVNKFVTRGAWRQSVKVNQTATGTDVKTSDWFFFIGDKNMVNLTLASDITNTMYCGFGKNTDGHYTYKKGGSMHNTSITVTIGDVLTISKKKLSDTQTQVVYSITNASSVNTEFDGDIIQNNDVEHIGDGNSSYMIKLGTDTGKIGFENLTYVPTSSVSVSSGTYTRVGAVSVPSVLMFEGVASIGPSPVSIVFPNDDTMQLFGFNDTTITQDVLSGTFVSQDKITFNIFNNDIVVELLDVPPLNGYDHRTKQSKNIIMVISSGEIRNSVSSKGSETFELSFTESATPLYVNMNNKQTTCTISKLTVRVTSEGKTLLMDGAISCLLLFKDEDNN